ncbi:hypothetical protein XM38_043240 [Halomicronema hongdechloris C2206]|uniref:Uncharacterized protein n=1 Tax=Halomicronema hongdechloris C2206 TaxID=1641165 RepID=A0A1Z3HST0_9CYAN|nr:hypothetical protein XM38_043240 [Halomicronema hongdechloris C2206]
MNVQVRPHQDLRGIIKLSEVVTNPAGLQNRT